ncbi:sigma-70 family RNA polymerase sigma factor [Bacillus sp. Bva_UNVM-123]
MQIHKIQLLKIALSYLRNEDDALEALQEVTFRAYQAVKKVKQPEYFSTWLIRIMLNYCHDQFKKKNRLVYADVDANISETVDYTNGIAVEEALQKLDPDCREVIILKYYHDLKIKDIAEILERPESTIKTWLYKGLMSLRQQLEERGELNA